MHESTETKLTLKEKFSAVAFGTISGIGIGLALSVISAPALVTLGVSATAGAALSYALGRSIEGDKRPRQSTIIRVPIS